MSPGTYAETLSNQFNPWRFSSCSVAYFNNFITSKMSTASVRQCLTADLTINTSVPDVSSSMLGQVYDPHQQCQQVHGQLSYFCQVLASNEIVDVCLHLYCFNPRTVNQCDRLRSAPGTSCGNKKWCLNGQCTYDVKAPAKDDTCLFGDRPGVVVGTKDCSTLISEFPGNCYQNQTRVICCQTCAKFYQPVQNCEYGDPYTGCNKQLCAYATTSYKQQCCGTCSFGNSSVTKSPTTLQPSTTDHRTLSLAHCVSPLPVGFMLCVFLIIEQLRAGVFIVAMS